MVYRIGVGARVTGMTGQAHVAGQVGLTRLARAVRRSTALWAAVMTSPEGTSKDDVVAAAEFYNSWLSDKRDEQEVPSVETFDPDR